ncbi:MAG: hypothetical protein AAFX87_09865 [Bacteroidota bacterium]
MKRYIIILLATLTFGVAHAQEFKKLWEVSSLEAPESVVFDKKNKRYIVSNVAGQPAEKNGQGYLSIVDTNGKVTHQKWATGFNAPKGLGIHGQQLYVADIDVVSVVDLKSGKVVKQYKAEGATFLNDVEVAKDGTVYITDTFGGNAIYKISKGDISLWVKDEKLNYPNGLKIKGKEIYVASWGVVTNAETFGTEVPGVLLAINLSDKSIRQVTSPTGNLDGLQVMDNKFLVSDWIAGGLMTIDANGEVKEVQDLNAGSADILLLQKQNILLVPQMLDGKLIAYEVQ